MVWARGAQGDYTEGAINLALGIGEIFPGEVIFLLISRMPTEFLQVPTDNVTDTSRLWFLHLVC